MPKVVGIIPFPSRDEFFDQIKLIENWHKELGIVEHRTHIRNDIGKLGQPLRCHYTWRFANSDHALIFKLTWGGHV